MSHPFGKLNRGQILDEAKRLTMGEREQEYGEPVESYTRAVTAFNALTGHNLKPHQGALFMEILKADRFEQSPLHLDTAYDGPAYCAIKGEIAHATLLKDGE